MPTYNLDASPFRIEKTDSLTLFNVMPKMTEKELLARIPGVSRMFTNSLPTTANVFAIAEDYGYGADKTTLRLEPGEKRTIPAQLARELFPLLRHKGVVMLIEGETDADARERGLNEAIEFLQTNGVERYQDRTSHLNDEEKRRQRLAFKNDLILMEKEKVVQDYMDGLSDAPDEESEPVEAPAKKAKKA